MNAEPWKLVLGPIQAAGTMFRDKIHINTQFISASTTILRMYFFGMWQEAGGPGCNPDTQAPHGEALNPLTVRQNQDFEKVFISLAGINFQHYKNEMLLLTCYPGISPPV